MMDKGILIYKKTYFILMYPTECSIEKGKEIIAPSPMHLHEFSREILMDMQSKVEQ